MFLSEQARPVVAAWSAAVDNTATGKTLATLKGSALVASARFFEVRPNLATDDVRWNPLGSVDATGAKVPTDGVRVTLAQAATAKFFCTAGANLTVLELI